MARRPLDPPVKPRKFLLTDEQMRLLRAWGRGDATAGLRWLITVAAPFISRVEKIEKKSEGDLTG